MTMTHMTNERKQELTKTIYIQWKKIANLEDPMNEVTQETDMEDATNAASISIRMNNIRQLKIFIIDRNCKGQKPKLILTFPRSFTQQEGIKAGFTDAETGGPPPPEGFAEEFLTVPKYPRDNQRVLDYLRREALVPDESTLQDYDFLFT